MKEMEVVKITPAFTDERGDIIDVLDNEDVRHVGAITVKKGTIRGNHYHKMQKQWMYIVEGEMEVFLKDVRNGEDAHVKTFVMKTGDLVYIPAGVVHSMRATKDTLFFDFNDKARGDGGLYEEDTIRVKIV